MAKFVIAPDSFKGTMSAVKVCEIIGTAVRNCFPDSQVLSLPLADGGEGTVDCLCLAIGAKPVEIETIGALGQPVKARYATMGDTAIVEMASVAGLHLAGEHPDPGIASTRGVGVLIKHAIESGCHNILLGLGGSCTNDVGVGMASALGVRFFDRTGNEFVPTGYTLEHVKRIDSSQADALLKHCKVKALCDVSNPLYGKNGAAFVYAPQKGADDTQVQELDRNMHAFAQVLKEHYGTETAEMPGAGAAGGMGAGTLCFLHGELQSGIGTLLKLVGFEEKIKDANLIITGEGRLDEQSAFGKTIAGISAMAQKHRIPVIVLAGCLGEGAEKAYEHGIGAIFGTVKFPGSSDEILKNAESNLASAADSVMRLIKICTKSSI